MADPVTEALEEQSLHDLITTFTSSLMQEQTSIPMSMAAKLAQFVSELHLLWQEKAHLNEAAPCEVERVERLDVADLGWLSQLKEAPADQPMQMPAATPVPPQAAPLTKRGKPRLTPEEITARRKAAWTPEKRALHRQRARERAARQQNVHLPHSIPA